MGYKKGICGVGINDTDCIKASDGTVCPYYTRWVNMIHRCYNKDLLEKDPCYKDVSVCDEWLVFSNFKEWMQGQKWEGNCLDKDLVDENSKLYSADNCLFIPQEVNSALRKGTMFAVTKYGRYRVNFKKHSKKIHFGSFSTEEEAIRVYLREKAGFYTELSNKYREDYPIMCDHLDIKALQLVMRSLE